MRQGPRTSRPTGVRQESSVFLLGRLVVGTLRPSDESYEPGWFAPAGTDRLPMVASARKRPTDGRAGADPVVR